MKKKLFFLMLTMLVVSPAILGQQTWKDVSPCFACSDILQKQYGVCTHVTRMGDRWDYASMNEQFSIMKDLGISYMRADFDWSNIQTQAHGKFNLNTLDKVVSKAKMYGITILPIVGKTTGFCQKPYEQVTLWDKYINEVVSRYSSKISIWEIWNEENTASFWKPTPNAVEYSKLLKRTNETIKTIDSRSKVMVGGMAQNNNEYIENLFKNTKSNDFDYFAVHYYPGSREPEQIIDYLSKVRDIQKEYNLNTPVWMTEIGASSLRNKIHSDEEQAIRLPRLLICSFALGIEKAFWYKLRSCELSEDGVEDHFGILHKDLSPKSSYYSFKTLIKMLPEGSSRPKLKQRGNLYLAEWSINGEKVYAMWCGKDKETVRLSIEGTFIAYDYMGNISRVSTSHTISEKVLYIKGAKSIEIL